LPFDFLSAALPDCTPGATANDGVEPGITHRAARYSGRITSEKSPRQPSRARGVITKCPKVIGADGPLIEHRRQSGGRRSAELPPCSDGFRSPISPIYAPQLLSSRLSLVTP